MSHAVAHPNEEATPLFTNNELREFAAEDAKAARVIGKILSTLFIYTLLAMAVVICWTYAVLSGS